MAKKTIQQPPLTIKEIAKIASVSPATISLVINGRPGVNEKTRKRILELVETMNYTPNPVARSLVQRRTYVVAMLITDTRNPIFPEIAAGVDDVLNAAGYSLSIISTYDSDETEALKIKRIRAGGIDGIIISSSLLYNERICGLVRGGFPVVSVLRRIYNCPELDYVTVDNFLGGYWAAEHLIRLGHKKIGLIRGPANTSTGLERYEGGIKAFADYGLEVSEDLVKQGDYFKKSGYEATAEMLRLAKSKRPTAIYACNDEMAFGALEATLDMGLKIPEDLALVGFNNVETTALRSIEITTITQRKTEIGKLAAKRLIDKIEKRRGYKKLMHLDLEPTLIIRKSCGYSVAGKYLIDKHKT